MGECQSVLWPLKLPKDVACTIREARQSDYQKDGRYKDRRPRAQQFEFVTLHVLHLNLYPAPGRLVPIARLQRHFLM